MFLFVFQIVSIITAFCTVSAFRYKVVITDDYIEANKLHGFFVKNDSSRDLFRPTGVFGRFIKGTDKIEVRDIQSAKICKQGFFGIKHYMELTAVIFTLKNGKKRKIDIALSGYYEQKKIIYLLKQKMEVDATYWNEIENKDPVWKLK